MLVEVLVMRSERRNNLKCPLANICRKQLWCINKQGYSLTINRKEVVIQAVIWLDVFETLDYVKEARHKVTLWKLLSL